MERKVSVGGASQRESRGTIGARVSQAQCRAQHAGMPDWDVHARQGACVLYVQAHCLGHQHRLRACLHLGWHVHTALRSLSP